jgi:hypothetical protein
MDFAWILLIGVCVYELIHHVRIWSKTNRAFNPRLIFAALYLVFPVMVVIGIGKAAIDNNGVIFFPKYAAAIVRSKVSKTKYNFEQISKALESYYNDNRTYPIPTVIYTLPNSLTTPVAYLIELPKDIMAPQSPPLGYAIDTVSKEAIIASRGPDWVWQIDFPHFSYAKWTAEYYELISYDPTNGTVSDGDIWRIGP